MQLSRTGVILNTENYLECVNFYQKILGLKVLFEKKEDDFYLTCFDFGGSYLMVESDGYANRQGKSIKENATKLRFNVPDIEEALSELHRKGIKAEIERHAWGSTINLYDPDGNRVGIKDEGTFTQQILDYQKT